MNTLGVDWRVGEQTGWEVFGAQVALELSARHGVDVRLLYPPDLDRLSQELRESLSPVVARSRELWAEPAGDFPFRPPVAFPVLRAVGNGLDAGDALLARPSRRNIGVVFIEDTRLGRTEVANARNFERILAGSRWNAELLRSAGVANVDVVLQGIDPVRFRPAPRTRGWPGRFVVFSGGKLEYRKAQDIVVAAFRVFRTRHPEALLVTAWHNPWPPTIAGIDRAGHVQGLPVLAGGRLDVAGWLSENGVPREASIDLGPLRHRDVPDILRAADVAVFPNRAEGGTNLVLMEAMACGVAVVASANTGHLDVVDHSRAWLLEQQGPVASPDGRLGTSGWGESSVEELVETLEQAYADPAARERRGQAAAGFMRHLTWGATADHVWDAVRTAGGREAPGSVA